MNVRNVLPTMKGPVITMGIVIGVTCGCIFYSHYAQVRDQTIMRSGVERDKERLRMKKQELKYRQQLQHPAEQQQ